MEQAPGTETVFKGARGDDPVYPAYTSDATQDFVGSKIGLEKVFALCSRHS